jgi:hypothetical protein
VSEPKYGWSAMPAPGNDEACVTIGTLSAAGRG